MEKNKTFYITTPIYYPSNKLHIGNAYTTIACDAMARYKRMRGYDVWFLTGTDEHGQKLQKRAAEEGKKPLEFINPVVEWIQDLWQKLDVSYDDFIRTTEERHKAAVQAIFQKLENNDDIYLSEYEGLYCTPCEAFWTERQAVEKKCPDCGRGVELVKEESYFFRMSKYQERLLKHIEDNPEFIQPESRRNEMVNNFLKPGLEDLCVSRTTFDWGIKVPSNSKHVIYVWIDALANYITALGYASEDDSKYKRFWPADVHMIGKDILRFHTIYWPITLMAIGEPLPKKVFGHGWLLMPDGKMSKSKGNVIDPKFLIEEYGSDAIRYFLLREIAFGSDGIFTPEAFIQRMNYDLANDLGNLLSRTVAMIEQNFAGRVPQAETEETEELDHELIETALATITQVENQLDQMQFSTALTAIWQLISRTNKYIDETTPWVLAKDEAKKRRLATVLYNLAEVLRIISVLLTPFMTKTPTEMQTQLGIAGNAELVSWQSLADWGKLPADTVVNKGQALYPRLDIKQEIAKIDNSTQADRQQAEANKKQSDKPQEASSKQQDVNDEMAGLVTIDDFMRLDLRVAQIRAAEPVAKADKLYCLQLQVGTDNKQVVAGIAKWYKPEQLLGMKVLFVNNLKPVKLRGVESQGMILAASTEDKLVLTTVAGDIATGAKVK